MFPPRLTFITYNLWGSNRWPERAEALRQFVNLFSPDILCIQELSEQTRTVLDQIMPRHERVEDELPGWRCESNIYWNGDLLEELEHGAEDIGLLEAHRRFFWVRLALRDRRQSIFVGTAHFTAQSHGPEIDTGFSPRPGYTRRIISALQRLVGTDEPAFIMGDFNDPVIPTRLLHACGYISCFSALGMPPPPTWKCYPTANVAAGAAVITQCVDWIVANKHARALCAQSPRCYHGDIAPSDHWPVQAVYQI
ncbi:MAG: endonuclease/exonuclease/phosphatase family protein [Pseudomonadota bacterium]